jgi:predicted nuclease of predicted toxin-antitoxin system
MRLLLDESIPVDLRKHLPSHQVSSVTEMGWAGSKNGLLLTRAARRFDVLITADKNMRYQQNMSRLPISVVILSARSNTLPALIPLVGKLEAVLVALPAHSITLVSG